MIQRFPELQILTCSQDEIQTTRSCPLPSKFFQGHKDILLQLDRFFQPIEKKEQKVVLLHGLGGAGKTQIALKFIAESGARFTDQFKINASSAETIEVGYKQIAMAKKLGDTAEAAQTWLKTHHAEWLLLFDNADQPNLDLEAYLPQCNHGNILITSRNPGLWVHTGSTGKAIAVSNLSLDDAVLLLLNRAGVELLRNENKMHAVQIAQELHCFPLAIVQAGAFISKSSPLRQDTSKYITLYRENKATLLGRKPEQSHGDYQWSVYTTWQISFDQLGPQAAQFLQLCSFIHFEGITEDIFQRASEYTPGNEPLDPSVETLQPASDFLSSFRNAESNWNSLKFGEIMSDICDYSLMTWQENAYSIHPLVHEWAGMTITNQIDQTKMIVALLGMATACSMEVMQKIQLLLHVMVPMASVKHGDVSTAVWFKQKPLNRGPWAALGKLEEQVLEKRTKLLGAEHPNTIDATAWLAVTFWSLGQYTEAQKLEEQVLEKRTKLLGAEHPNTIDATATLAVIFWSLGQYTEAQKLQEQVMEKQTKVLGAEHPNTILARANLAVTFWSLGKYTEAQKLEEQVLEKRTKLLGAEHPNTIDATATLVVIFWSLGQYTEAQKLQEQVMEKQTKVLGAEHPNTIDATATLAVIFWSLGQYTEAEKLQEQVLEKQTKVLGAEHPNTIDATATLAVIFWSLGQYTEAEKLQEQVLEKQTKVLGAEHPNTILARANLADTYRTLGQYIEAQKLEEQVLEKQTKLLGAEHPNTIDATANLAATFWSLGQYTEAQKLEEQVLEKRTKVQGAEHPNTIDATATLASMFWSLGQYTEAQKLEEQEKYVAKDCQLQRDYWKNRNKDIPV
ncbi:P-loop containing nucleoside triphosphate hydrolase protein [Mycena amicta]|nr:P-loop containing nucleoside triphosphate hydrolase protein [Mycena amicta]